MHLSASEFDPVTFSFHEEPVLVIEGFWTASERQFFREAMRRTAWQCLTDMPAVQFAFPHCGNWQKGRMASPEIRHVLEKLAWPCIETYMASFSGDAGRSLNFSYYSYGAGDGLLTHDDTAQEAGDGALRRLAIVSYVHEEWQPDWGGELILYSSRRPPGLLRPRLCVSHCIAPEPGSIVLFTVPRFHRVSRVDPLVGDQRRLSIAGWLMTTHAGSTRPASSGGEGSSVR